MRRDVSFLLVSYWLLKTEPETFSIDALDAEGVSHWDGVRSFQARNNLRAMKVGERAFFYHSSCDPPGVVGICEVVREAYPDHTAWDPTSKYFDERSTPDNPMWFMPDVRFVEKFPRMVTLAEMRATPELEGMFLLRKGARLSVQPVTDEQWRIVCALAGREEIPEAASPAPEQGTFDVSRSDAHTRGGGVGEPIS